MKLVQVLLIMLFSVIVNSVYAYDFKADGIYYNILSAADKTCEVTSGDAKYTGDVTIPSTVQYNGRTLSVTKVGDNAFSSCTGLKSVAIPNSINNIGEYAFYNCTGLVSIEIPNSVTNLGDNVFDNCTGLISVTIPSSITRIGYRAFSYCASLSSIFIPNSVLSIGYSAFEYCTSLTSVAIPNSVTEIEGSAFSHCENLRSVAISNSLKEIDYCTFEYCSKLSSITIPNSVTTIKSGAFWGCFDVNDVSIPSSVTKIDTSDPTKGTPSFSCDPKICTFGSDYAAESINRNSIVKLTLMDDVTSFYHFGGDKLDTLVSLTTTPPIIWGVSEKQKTTLKVFVPKGTLAAYQAADVWKEFWNLQEIDAITGISSAVVPKTDAKGVGLYSITGVKIEQKRPGINIIKMSDGSIRKVLVK